MRKDLEQLREAAISLLNLEPENQPLGKEILFENHDFQVPCSTWGCFILGSKLPGQLLAASVLPAECWLNPGLDSGRWVQDWTEEQVEI